MFRSRSADNIDDETSIMVDGAKCKKRDHVGNKSRRNDHENSFTYRRSSTGNKPPLKPKPPVRTRGLSSKKAGGKGRSSPVPYLEGCRPASVIGNPTMDHGSTEFVNFPKSCTENSSTITSAVGENHAAVGNSRELSMTKTAIQMSNGSPGHIFPSGVDENLPLPVRPARRPRPKSAGSNRTISNLNKDEPKNNEVCIRDNTSIVNVINEEKKDYWSEYEEKYGRLGIMDDVMIPVKSKSEVKGGNDVVARYTSGKYTNNFVEQEKESLSRSSSPSIVISEPVEKNPVNEETDLTVALIDETDNCPVETIPHLPPKSSRHLRPMRLNLNSPDRTHIESDSECPEKTEVLLAQYRKKIGRPRGRSVSDLGFSLHQKGANAIPTPRTAALLNDPSMRKHLSKVLHVKEESLCDNDFSWDFRLKMAHLANSSPTSSPTESANSTPKLLRGSVSEPRLGQQGKPQTGTDQLSSISTSYESLSIDIPSFDLDVEGPRSARGHNDGAALRRGLRTPFSLPSFDEFKSMRRSGNFQACSPLYQNENSIKEEDESDIRSQRSPEIQPRVQGHNMDDDSKSMLDLTPQKESHSSHLKRSSSQELNRGGHESGQKGQQGQLDPSERTARTSHELLNRHRKESRRRRRASEGDSDYDLLSSLDDLQKHLQGHPTKNDLSIDGDNRLPHSRSPADLAKIDILLHDDSSFDGIAVFDSPNVPSSKVTSKPPLPSKPKVKTPLKQSVRSSSMETTNSPAEQQQGSVKSLVGQFEKRSSSLDSCDFDALDKNDSVNKLQSGKLQRREAFLRKRSLEGDENKRRPNSVLIESSDMPSINVRVRPKSVIGLEGSYDAGGIYMSDDRSTSGAVVSGSEVHQRGNNDDGAEVRHYSTQSITAAATAGSITSDSLSPDAANVDSLNVLRSTSDVSDLKAEEGRKKVMKEKRIKPYKSDPQCGVISELCPASPPLCHATPEHIRSERSKRCSMSSTREDILGFLQDIRQSGTIPSDDDDQSQSSFDSGTDEDDLFSEVGRHSYRLSRSSSHSSWKSRSSRSRKGSYCGGEVERVDSGVGSDIKEGSFIKRTGSICEDCDHELDVKQSDRDEFVCKRCAMRRRERKETIQEIVDTECSYGNDLTIIKQEFYIPMKTAGLISKHQLHTIFCNIDELMRVNTHFVDQLKDALEMASDQGDEDYMHVDIGRLFLNASNMLMAFEEYCVGRSMALGLLEQLERDRELLRIFLQVSQIEKSQLRRMGLKAFLMLPVQRVMKYPLLLGRIYKLTPPSHPDKEMVKKAQVKVEEILEHINKKTKGAQDSMNVKLRRKFSSFKRSFQIAGPIEKQELLKISLELLGWSKSDVSCILIGRLQCTQPTDHLWAKKIRTLKYTNVHAVLLTLGTAEDIQPQGMFGHQAGVKEAALILLKEKGAKIVSLREPLLLSKCVVSMDADCDEVFEVMDSNKEAYLLKSDDPAETLQWLSNVRHQSRRLGHWRKRRNALPNIMVQLTS